MKPSTERAHPVQRDAGPRLLSVREAGETLAVSTSTVWRMIRRGDLASVRMGGRRLIPADALEARTEARRSDELTPFTEDHPIFRLVGAGRSGGEPPGARDKHAILDR